MNPLVPLPRIVARRAPTSAAPEDAWLAEFARKLARLRQARPALATLVERGINELVDRLLADTAWKGGA